MSPCDFVTIVTKTVEAPVKCSLFSNLNST